MDCEDRTKTKDDWYVRLMLCYNKKAFVREEYKADQFSNPFIEFWGVSALKCDHFILCCIRINPSSSVFEWPSLVIRTVHEEQWRWAIYIYIFHYSPITMKGLWMEVISTLLQKYG